MSFMHQYNANSNVPFEVVPLIMGDDAFNSRTITASPFVPTQTQILPSMYLPPGYDYANQQCAMASTNDGHTYMQFNDSGKMGKSYPTHDIGPAAAIAQPINGAAMVMADKPVRKSRKNMKYSEDNLKQAVQAVWYVFFVNKYCFLRCAVNETLDEISSVRVDRRRKVPLPRMKYRIPP
ncbi:hypothetical protein PRIPAC_96701 [Pristionchus pacificus]|uniref:Uncharacterized protein n=1 Tax=Pristionchus pacificus TaxID=54126 RepID=A0A2A6D2I9_PRIPA|nr:hypothetical protein PRIPAC_96701 [Pristionchus pacificus]|eukprot:PDM84501.1 hypothetical protein PRIPAC_33524 [Pristionchus pacificus]